MVVLADAHRVERARRDGHDPVGADDAAWQVGGVTDVLRQRENQLDDVRPDVLELDDAVVDVGPRLELSNFLAVSFREMRAICAADGAVL